MSAVSGSSSVHRNRSNTPDMDKLALYFGSLGTGDGHWLHGVPTEWRRTVDPQRSLPGFPWSARLIDSGLLKNKFVLDIPDGRVFWTVGRDGLDDVYWLAFFWWDRSSDRRGASNSGFYVRGFNWPQRDEAFAYACAAWPEVVARQKFPLVLQP